MNLIEVMERYPDQESCIDHLERIRWRGTPICLLCGCIEVVRKKEDGVGRVGRWHCSACKASFKVTHGTVFHGTKIPLQKWFLAISLILNAKKGLSSYQLQRDLDLNQKTAWYMLTRIRAEMSKKGGALLQGIIEADETYIGGKPRKENKKEDREPAKRGRGTDKTPVIGGREMKHQIVNHQEQYVDGDVHTNTIEGFWSLLKRAWYGSHHHYTTGFTPLYVAERCYVYNYRNLECIWAKFINESVLV